MRNPGYIFKTDTQETVIAYHKDQNKVFEALGKVVVTAIREGQPKKIMKAKGKLKFIGFSD